MSRNIARVLAIAPVSRGLGVFALGFRGKPLDWRVIEIRGAQKNARCQVKVDALIDEFRPRWIALEDHRAKGAKRKPRVCELIDLMAETAIARNVRVVCIGRHAVRQALSLPPNANKDKVAASIAKHYPALADRLPTPRRLWQVERYAMPIFSAAALAHAQLRNS